MAPLSTGEPILRGPKAGEKCTREGRSSNPLVPR